MEEKHICDYGCGQEAQFQFKSGKWCCSKNMNSCPAKKERSRLGGIGKKHDLAKEIITNELCSFGCGQEAKFIYKNGSYCCKNDWHRCLGKHDQISETTSKIWSDLDRRKRLSESQHKNLFAVAIPISDDDKVCYDCGQKAKFWFKTNNRYCCSDRIEKCQVVKEIISKRTKINWTKDDFRNKIMSQNYNDPVRIKKQVESYKKWCINNPDKLKEKGKLTGQKRLGKTFEELFGIERAKELKIKAKNRLKGKTFEELFGIEKTKQIKEKMIKKLKGRKETRKEIIDDMSVKKKLHWADPNSSYNTKEFRLKKSEESKRRWKDPEFNKKYQKSIKNSPNGPERKLIEIFKELNLEYEFVGNRSLSIDGRNPDFINRNSNKLIEHFGIYHHDTIVSISREDHELERINFFLKYGYKTLIIWENEWSDINTLKDKILEFDKT